MRQRWISATSDSSRSDDLALIVSERNLDRANSSSCKALSLEANGCRETDVACGCGGVNVVDTRLGHPLFRSIIVIGERARRELQGHCLSLARRERDFRKGL